MFKDYLIMDYIRKPSKFVSLSVSILFLFYFFSKEIKNGFLTQTDFTLTVKIQERIDKSSKLRLAAFVGDVMEGATFFASPEFSVIVVGVLSIFSLYDWKKKKIRLAGLLIPLCFGLLILGEVYGKNVVHHPSPPFFMIKNPTTIFPKYYINDQFSYPSGHAARALYTAVVSYSVLVFQYLLVTRKRGKILLLFGLFGYVGLVSVSRIYLGHHWTSDIIGGLLLGGGFALLTLAPNSLIIDKQ